MKKADYDQELMDQYIDQKCYELSCEPITEEERKMIADTLDFNAYCLYVAWKEFVNALATAFHLHQLRDWVKRKIGG